MSAQAQHTTAAGGSKHLWALRPIDWKWVGMGYCFFVVFHMLPSYFAIGMHGMAGNGLAGLPGLWLFIGLAFVGFLVGYRSQGVTVLEPGISSLFYALTLLYFMGQFTGQDISLSTIAYAYVTIVAIFVTAVFSAWLGEKVQERKDAKRAQAASERR